MSISSTPFPLKLRRQQAEPIDEDGVFATTADRLAYLTNPRRYAGQFCWDSEAQKAFVLNQARNAWLELSFVSGGGGNSIIVTTDTVITIPSRSYVVRIVVNPTLSTPQFKIGSTLGGEEYWNEQDVPVGSFTPFSIDKFFDDETDIYIGGITGSTELITYID